MGKKGIDKGLGKVELRMAEAEALGEDALFHVEDVLPVSVELVDSRLRQCEVVEHLGAFPLQNNLSLTFSQATFAVLELAHTRLTRQSGATGGDKNMGITSAPVAHQPHFLLLAIAELHCGLIHC